MSDPTHLPLARPTGSADAADAVGAGGATGAADNAEQDRAHSYWQHVLRADRAVPDDRPITDLTAELVSMLGSPAPAVREAVGFDVLSSWVAAGVYDDLLASLGDSVARGLSVGLGATADETVFRRVLSARVLTACLARDHVARVLTVDVVIRWAERALSWLTREQDLRGDISGHGRACSLCAGGDLLAALAASRHLTAEHLGVLLDVVTERIATTTEPLPAGADDCLALAVLTVCHRDLVDIDVVEAWVSSMAGLAGGATTPASHNALVVLRTVFVLLSTGVTPVHAGARLASVAGVRADLLLALASSMPRPLVSTATRIAGCGDDAPDPAASTHRTERTDDTADGGAHQ